MQFKHRISLLFAALLVLNCAGNWILPIVDRDEPRFAEASREMRERGDYVVPFFNGHERFDKPPLIYWLQAASFAVLGENEFAARLPTAVTAAMVALAIAFWGARVYDETTGIRAALMFGLCLQLFVHGRAAVADMPMVLSVTLAAASGWEWVRGPWSRRFVAGAVFWTALGVGFLAKGPIALIPLAMVVYAARSAPESSPRAAEWIGGALLMGAVIAAWGVPALAMTDGAFARVGLGRHVVQRSFVPMEGHGAEGALAYVATLPFYFVTLFGSLFPWSIWLIPAARFFRRSENRGSFENYLLVGAVVVFSIFTLSRTKLPHYTMPAFPFFCLLIAAWWRDRRTERLFRRAAASAAAGVIALSLIGFSLLRPSFVTDTLYERAGQDIPPNADFAAVGYQEPSLVWVFRQRVTSFMQPLNAAAAPEFMARSGPRFCVIAEPDLPAAFPQLDPSWRIYRAEGFQVAKGKRVRLVLLLKGS